ncbi:class I SAM-dependent methyltransferase [Methylobacterium sp. WL9]|uniref:class I SAM-dependent methyltransferase n=1 Tax=Methylobacterium sp. WL9 TaxID=2603898 RepID=UPI0011D964F6|nr:class I SAM-dependent methyltransferase [Methylobacterium sp. WL9]TXN20061.1 class I SAM-dependent methyltransferase [Methylobacterium sp. WL9]
MLMLPWLRRSATHETQDAAILAPKDVYMSSAIPVASDYDDERFWAFCQQTGMGHGHHRKLWEFVFIFEKLKQAGMLQAGKRGLVFACGSEPLPSLFASLGCEIVATDGPPEITDGNWYIKGEHADGLDSLYRPEILSREAFDRNVRFEYADMNDIPDHLTDFDFCWSACSLEHLGSLRKGMDFVVNSIERTLKLGGLAVHTTEYNFSSDEKTMEQPGCSIYRQRDMIALRAEIMARGHRCDPILCKEGKAPEDIFVDLPPYGNGPHLKMELDNYVVTSIGFSAYKSLKISGSL